MFSTAVLRLKQAPGFLVSFQLIFDNLNFMCWFLDPNVEVIYVSPIEILEDFNQYYKKLLGIRSAVDAADPDAIGDLTSRFTIVVPDALNKFPVR